MSYKRLTAKDADFTFSPDGVIIVPRASIELDRKCPDHYIRIILEAHNNGWLTAVANMRDPEYTMELLRK